MVMAIAAMGQAMAGDPFSEFVRSTGPLSPEQEQKSFHLPPGFEIQLVASEPEIAKPMNMAFDQRGRLWVTESREYPFPAATNQPGRDAIKVLSHFDANGKALKVATFADKLNIPIGLYPYRNGAVAFSIPQIWRFEDADGDGVAENRSGLYAGQGFDLDTHGLTSSFRRGFDGWIYADHGYRNNTTLKGTDGYAIVMNSGNTYRMKLDGSRVEQFTWGQVNPFGLMFDPLGDLFSADCHSSPVYQLLRGAYYPSFGKPHDGLGYAPMICAHSHGSTAIAGIVLYYAEQFPAEFRGNSFIGNVMTCRVNRDSFVEEGSTRQAKEEPDFLSSDDPWFRPVDLQLGPDGALYVADFYNRIIGHYEVPLDHPGRDRERGRIWRIVYRGGKTIPSPEEDDLSRAAANKLIEKLADANIAVRMLAMNELSDRVGRAAIGPIEKMLGNKRSSPWQRVHGLWVLHRLGALKEKNLEAATADPDRAVRVHAMRILSEIANWAEAASKQAVKGLQDKDPYVRRAAADALGRHPQPNQIRPLLALREATQAADAQLLHVTRIALRNQLQAPGGYLELQKQSLNERESLAIADVSLGVKSPQAGGFLLQHLKGANEPRERMLSMLVHAGRHAPLGELDSIGEIVRKKFPTDPDVELAAFKAVQEGLGQRGATLSAGVRSWALRLAQRMISEGAQSTATWETASLGDGMESPWALQRRKSADGKADAMFLSSLPVSEQLMGIIRSKPFTIPGELKFFLAGHDGAPNLAPLRKNFVQLIDAASGAVLKKTFPPRNDMAQPVTWDLKEFAGRQGRLELVDGHSAEGYAWLAAGRFEPDVAPLPEQIGTSSEQRKQSAAELTRTLPLPEMENSMAALAGGADNSPAARAAAVRALLAIDSQKYVPSFAGQLMDTNQAAVFRERLAGIMAEVNSAEARAAVIAALGTMPRRSQTTVATVLAGSAGGSEALLSAAEQRKLSPAVLADRPVKERMKAAKVPKFEERFDAVTKSLPEANAELVRLMDERRAGFDAEHASATRGAAVFAKSCALCHQIDGQGVIIGPQLDGVGNRGLERLIEDVLDPNRNVDPAFRYSIVTLKDDTSVTGLQRREEGETVVFADATGKEVTVAKKDIAQRRESELSLMPSNFSEVLKLEEFYDLMAFLLAHGKK